MKKEEKVADQDPENVLMLPRQDTQRRSQANKRSRGCRGMRMRDHKKFQTKTIQQRQKRISEGGRLPGRRRSQSETEKDALVKN